MRIVFMGTPEFARPSLERLYQDGYDIVGVFTQPDRPRSRGMRVSYSPVKELALRHGSPVFQPESLRGGDALGVLVGLRCDLIVVVAYGRLLPPEFLGLPPLGCVNIHASLLPKYRGAAPIQWAILNGERETGVCSMFISEELDAGDLIGSISVPVFDDESSGELHNRLSVVGAELLGESVGAIKRGKVVRQPQDHSKATFAPPLNKEMSPIDWTETALKIKCKVRGLCPWPSATSVLFGINFKIFSVDVCVGESGKAPGEIVRVDSDGIVVACLDGVVIIRELQAPGGKRMSVADYLRGHQDVMLKSCLGLLNVTLSA